MSDRKWTPGPWKRGSHRAILKGDHAIAETFSWMGVEVADANEHLIAAAPDLYEALEEALKHIETWNARPDQAAAFQKASAALAKARGENPASAQSQDPEARASSLREKPEDSNV